MLMVYWSLCLFTVPMMVVGRYGCCAFLMAIILAPIIPLLYPIAVALVWSKNKAAESKACPSL